jgi:hypothetical protein
MFEKQFEEKRLQNKALKTKENYNMTQVHTFRDWCCHLVKNYLWTYWPPSPSKQSPVKMAAFQFYLQSEKQKSRRGPTRASRVGGGQQSCCFWSKIPW